MPTAFVCNCDLVTQRLIVCLRKAGYRVPEDISVTGFDDYITGARNDSEISTFRVDTDSMVGHVIKLITERCAGLHPLRQDRCQRTTCVPDFGNNKK